jgi:thiamine biosynthesis lipoprotein
VRRVLVPLSLSEDRPALGSVVYDAAGSTMGTSWSARAVLTPGAQQANAAALVHDLQRQLDIVVAQMSHWEPESDLSRYNSAPAGTWRHLPSAFYKVLSYALDVAQLSGGAYDPCAGAQVNRWGFGARERYDEAQFRAPDAGEVGAILARQDRQRVELDAGARKLLQPGGVALDLSSVAKGYAVDQLAHSLELRGIRHYLVEVGGELRGAGIKPDGQPWWVTLEGVPDAGEQAATVVALHGLAVATSGDYRRHYLHAGTRASHTLDPRSGQPIQNNVASVTVLHADCMAADALSTALSVLGPEAGLELAEAQQLAARFLVRGAHGLEESTSSAFKAMLQ